MPKDGLEDVRGLHVLLRDAANAQAAAASDHVLAIRSVLGMEGPEVLIPQADLVDAGLGVLVEPGAGPLHGLLVDVDS